MAVSFEISGLDIAIAHFNGMSQRAKNPKSVMAIVGAKAWRGVVDDNFRDEKDESGTRWQQLAAPRRGKRHKGSHKLLQDTGFLRRSTGWKNSIDEAIVYNACKYAGVHNYGYKKRNIPKRQFMYVNDKNMLYIMKTLTKYITDGSFDVS